ncbi:MAG: hypothetical protein KZQ64_04705 [gamma proteobacterium symbiont of Bathyaustriella thionipta]|nr:hypothetical protein [gamma proteobacterium symbiont of Bathyaustriella thionipta]MCU7952680.1 hypothetical protein [gamma proteobacterium symbiont of Bathyaustriella thionipta]MCU7957366.1 hypothetical protein [gamma proteobacterium symbiont of Bathyaustriella thionipta]MCU7967268.1 hypothetical protein [gamma proteobacterium symbiont of Bathyaustriella thionipta]
MKKITCLIIIITPVLSQAECEIAIEQREQVTASTEAHKNAVNTIINETIKKPEPSEIQACLDGLMGINLNVLEPNPKKVFKSEYSKKEKEITSMSCDAVQTAWNDAVTGMEGQFNLPFDLGGLSITATKGDWGNEESEDLKISNTEVTAWSKDYMFNTTNTDAVDDETIIEEGMLLPDFEKDKNPITDDLKQTFKDRFF